MRKVLKAIRKNEDVKKIHTPIKSSGQNRFRAGSDSITKLSRNFTIGSNNPNRRKPNFRGEPSAGKTSRTNLSAVGYEADGTQTMGTSPPSHRSYGGDSRKTDFTVSQAEGSTCVDPRSLDYMSEGVVQVVEELMEQTCILKNRLVEMVAQYQEKLCQCTSQNANCACLAAQPGGYYVEDDVVDVDCRSRGGAFTRDSSGYESTTARDSIVSESPVEAEYRRAYVDCRCEKTNPRLSVISEAPTRISNAYRLSNAYTRPTVVGQHEVNQQRSPGFGPRLSVTSEPPPGRLLGGRTTQCGLTSGCPCSQQQQLYRVSNQFPQQYPQQNFVHDETRLVSGSHFQNAEVSNAKRCSDSGYKSAPEFTNKRDIFDTQKDSESQTQAELTKKLAIAQKQIDDLKKLVKSFISCNCSKNYTFQQKRTSTELIGKADSIQELLTELKCDCNMNPEKCRFRSGAERKKQPEAESTATKAEEKSSKHQIAEPKSDKTESQKPAGPTKVIPQINSSIREINTIKQNDVVFSPDGRVIKTIEKVQRTEIVDGQPTQSLDLIAHGDDLEIKMEQNSLFADKQGSKHKSKVDRLHKSDQVEHAFQRDSEESKTSSKSSILNHRRKDNQSSLKIPITPRRQSEIRMKAGFEQRSFKRSRHKYKKKTSHNKKKHTLKSTESSADGVEEEMPQESSARPLETTPIPHNGNKHNEEYIIREYIYPNAVNTHSIRNDCGRVSVVGCKFSEKKHSAANTLNLGGKADSYFIEVLPKKSHSFNGISAPQNQQNFPNVYNHNAQRRPSGSNILSNYRNEVEPLTTRYHHAEEKEFSQKLAEQTLNVRHKDRKRYQSYMANHTAYDTVHNSLSAARQRRESSLRVLVQNVKIDQIPHIIRQLGGKRTSKEFFISVMPEKRPSKNLRVNVIDKETGNLLGYFFVEENDFQQARARGLFDNYLSLFVLNSYSTFSEFRNGVNPKILNEYNCFGSNLTH